MSKSPVKRVRKAAAPPPVPADVASAVKAADGKKATEIAVLDLRKADGFTDFFVICTAQNQRQIKAVADAVEEALRVDHGRKPAHVEGYGRAEWVLLDYFDFVLHVFTPEMRTFYGLERLWGSASSVDVTTVLASAATR
jgi:ribosome-associated protein